MLMLELIKTLQVLKIALTWMEQVVQEISPHGLGKLKGKFEAMSAQFFVLVCIKIYMH